MFKVLVISWLRHRTKMLTYQILEANPAQYQVCFGFFFPFYFKCPRSMQNQLDSSSLSRWMMSEEFWAAVFQRQYALSHETFCSTFIGQISLVDWRSNVTDWKRSLSSLPCILSRLLAMLFAGKLQGMRAQTAPPFVGWIVSLLPLVRSSHVGAWLELWRSYDADYYISSPLW